MTTFIWRICQRFQWYGKVEQEFGRTLISLLVQKQDFISFCEMQEQNN